MKYFKLFLLLFLVSILTTCDVQRKNALRIKSINEDKPLKIDVIDIYSYEEEGEKFYDEAIWDHYARIEFLYTEIGLGLPTAPGTYTALLTDYEITFEDITPGMAPEDRFKGEKVKGKCNIIIPSDPEGKKSVEAVVKVMPESYIEMYLDELSEFRVLGAKIKFRGKDLLSDKSLEVEGSFTIDVGDYVDDVDKLEPPQP
uniref:DUF4382 domain-containing protein n=1 Tax=candidate division WOR-3 bacterium TaxID=2052148 RepID=A0A7V6CN97_UNCW3